MKAIAIVFLWYLSDYAVQGDSNFWACGWNLRVLSFQMKAVEQYFPSCTVYLRMLYKVVLLLSPRIECDHSITEQCFPVVQF